MDLAVAITWIVVSIIAVISIIFGWVILSRTPSRKNGVHAFMASLLTSRLLFCLGVTSFYSFQTFLFIDWTVLGCHALYWIWTVAWVSDIIGVGGATIWGLIKRRHLRSCFRLGATIAIAGSWLVATTSAGMLAYFNSRIKDREDLETNGCVVFPRQDDSALSVAIFSILIIGTVTCIFLLVAFLIVMRTLANPDKEESVNNGASHISVNAQTVNGDIHNQIRREPSRLEAIEEYHVRRGTCNQSVILNDTERQRLRDWRNIFCVTTALLILLNILPHLAFLCIHILRHTFVPQANVILVSCQLANCLLLPVAMVTVSSEYRLTACAILRRKKSKSQAVNGMISAKNGITKNGKSISHEDTNKGDSSSPPPSGLQHHHQNQQEEVLKQGQQQQQEPQEEQQQGVSNTSYVGTETLGEELSPNIVRSSSHLSRLEWKEQMMRSAKLPLSSQTLEKSPTEIVGPAKTSVSSLSSGDSDSENAISGAFHESDIDRALRASSLRVTCDDTALSCRHSSSSRHSSLARQSTTGQSTGKVHVTREASVSSAKESDSTSRLPQKKYPKKRKRKDKNDRRARDIYATISRALAVQDGSASKMASSPRPGSRAASRSEMVYSPTNPFLNTLHEESIEADTESERSVEAEIVAITIRGRGSLKRKLKNRGLVSGVTYIPNGNEMVNYPLTGNVTDKTEAKHSFQSQYTANHGVEDVIQETSPNVSSTNPFVTSMRSNNDSVARAEKDISKSYTKQWVETNQHFSAYDPSPHHSNPFVNYGFNNDTNDIDNDVQKTRSSSNPFLQDITNDQLQPSPGQTEVTKGQVKGYTSEDDFIIRSAPSSPSSDRRVRTAKPAALAVAAVEMMKSKDDVRATNDLTGGRNTRQKYGFIPESYVTEYL